MTTVTGIPTLPGATVRVRVDGPFYQRGDLAGPGQYVGTWDGASLKDDDGNVINIVMPRKDQGDPIISRDVIVFITYTFSGKRDFTQKLTYRPIYWVETSAGVFDLSTNPDPDVPQIATVEQLRRFSDLLAEGTALNAESTRLQADIAQSEAARQQASQQLATDLTSRVEAAGTQAMALRVGMTYATDAQRVAAAPVDGTTAYVLETRAY